MKKNKGLLILLSVMLCYLSACSSAPKKELHLFTWSEFFKPELIEQFEEEFQCQVSMTFYDSNESMYAKLKLGSSGYDLIFPSSYFLNSLITQHLIIPLDRAKIPHINDLDPQYLISDKNEPLYGIPFLIAFSGIAYRKDRLLTIEPSFQVFGRKDLKGRITLLNDLRDVMGAALKAGGHSVNSRDPREIDAAAEQIINWKQNIAKFESEQYKSGIAGAEFLIVHAHSIDIAQVQQENQDVVFIYPKEGAVISIDCIAMPTGVQNKELAYAFINFMLEPHHAAENMAYIHSLIPVRSAYKLLDPALRSNPLLFPSQQDKDRMEIIEDVGDNILYYYKAWDRAKNSS